MPGRGSTVQATSPNAFTANVCGANGCNGLHHGANTTVYGVAQQILNSHQAGTYVVHIGLQEICWSQMATFHPWLVAYINGTYTGGAYFQLSGSAADSACGGTGRGPYGISAYAFGTGSPLVFDNGPFPTQYPGDEARGSVCILGYANGYYTACTAHMTPHGYPSYPNGQFNQYVNNEIVPRAYGPTPGPVFWGGDTYVTPDQITNAVPGWSYASHLEADRCGGSINRWTYNKTSVGDGDKPKYDWLFRSGPGRSCGADASLWPATSGVMYPSSGYIHPWDHRIEGGRWG